ncbi:MAG TPA: hypothetical protein VLL54_15640 [Pyrinomonadaceae bacterium]|nr:hypothetical protein [Pyrinomonadaceae bacterium]
MPTSEDLQRIINASGFLFQLRVESEVRATKSVHQWEVLAREHPWRQAETGKSGYIDLVLDSAQTRRGGGGQIRLVIECKRTSGDATWVFLVPFDSARHLSVRAMWATSPKSETYKSGWFDLNANPASYVSEFCAVRGAGEGQAPMLERICQNLLESTDNLALEEIHLYDAQGKRFIYVPVIVTNADVQVCKFRSEEVSLEDGRLEGGVFESVPFIRFHKSLATSLNPNRFFSTIPATNRNKMRTVIVVKASYLSKLLEEWEFNDVIHSWA